MSIILHRSIPLIPELDIPVHIQGDQLDISGTTRRMIGSVKKGGSEIDKLRPHGPLEKPVIPGRIHDSRRTERRRFAPLSIGSISSHTRSSSTEAEPNAPNQG